MPSLKDLSCSIELGQSQQKLQEHGKEYGDGYVETFVAVPTEATPFAVRLTSSAYIAEGLAMYVFIDGIYQCNRNRQGLKNLCNSGKPLDSQTLVDFTVRQKEHKLKNGDIIAREWKFEKLNIITADAAPKSCSANVLENIGCIEVVILRCKSDRGSLSIPLPKKKYVHYEPSGFDGASDRSNDQLGIDGKHKEWGYESRGPQTQSGRGFAGNYVPPPSGFQYVRPPQTEGPPSSVRPILSYRRQPQSAYDQITFGHRYVPRSDVIGHQPRFESEFDLFRDRTPSSMSTTELVNPAWLKQITEDAYQRGLQEAERQKDPRQLAHGNTDKQHNVFSMQMNPHLPRAWPHPPCDISRTSSGGPEHKTIGNIDGSSHVTPWSSKRFPSNAWGTSTTTGEHQVYPHSGAPEEDWNTSTNLRNWDNESNASSWGVGQSNDPSGSWASSTWETNSARSVQQNASTWDAANDGYLDDNGSQISSSWSSNSTVVSPRTIIPQTQARQTLANQANDHHQCHSTRSNRGGSSHWDDLENSAWEGSPVQERRSSASSSQPKFLSQARPQSSSSAEIAKKLRESGRRNEPKVRAPPIPIPVPMESTHGDLPPQTPPPPYSIAMEGVFHGVSLNEQATGDSPSGSWGIIEPTSPIGNRTSEPSGNRSNRQIRWGDVNANDVMPGSWEGNDHPGDQMPISAKRKPSESAKSGTYHQQEKESWLQSYNEFHNDHFVQNAVSPKTGISANSKDDHSYAWHNNDWNESCWTPSKPDAKGHKDGLVRSNWETGKHHTDSLDFKNQHYPLGDDGEDREMKWGTGNDPKNQHYDFCGDEWTHNKRISEKNNNNQLSKGNPKSRLRSYRRLRDPSSLTPKPHWTFPPPPPTRKLYPIPEDYETNPIGGDRAWSLPEEPLHTIPSSKAYSEGISHQVRAGKGHQYTHSISRPQYIDTLKNPYAVFRFKYRSRDYLQNLFPGEVTDEEPIKTPTATDSISAAKKLREMTEEQKIEEIMKLKSMLIANAGASGADSTNSMVRNWVGDQQRRSRENSRKSVSRPASVQSSNKEWDGTSGDGDKQSGGLGADGSNGSWVNVGNNGGDSNEGGTDTAGWSSGW